MVWKAIAASATGTSHTRNQLPCQDYGNFVVLEEEDIIIGAVSDGAGSAKYSDIGSQLAVQSALESLQKWLGIHISKGHNVQEPIADQMAERVFTTAFNQVVRKLEEKVKDNKKDNPDYSLKNLSCTLLLFIATRDWIAGMQIGDGFIVARSENSDYQLLFKPTKGEYANQTTFVTSKYAMEDMQVKVLSDGNYYFICASTDGLERLSINTRTWHPSASFFEPFEKGLEQETCEKEEESVKEWLNSTEVNDRTDDDKTMLVCVYDKTIISTDKTETEDAKTDPPITYLGI
ncbi:PP2C family serine/threonine-protein phosphatase [Roseofilum reptotaenium CS-1145]|uniref:PPM-type phosphatase domain-containing protein n=1 Tax=Roseofilum reptotaenium AO1-A TaxID=1925591 RepID=A0A1L9QTR8_9CYAN|nr:PP2C family serine/threonine-protein phosphatase [Roseofilum reptotaenium]MDB9519028.1 PP2C family serine/threonine-protein phosphatase [Roseofilum reptotaenium CS-1145]OJJ26032.1 hypothetical protein BI308_08730 [Roseofilum reptotaenium AO1-A]